MNKTLLKNFATQARVRLMKDVAYRLGLMGITNKGNAQPTVRQPGMEAYEYAKGEQFKLFGTDIEARRHLAEEARAKGFDQLVEEVAYTWFNRLIAIRFMEVNDYLPTHTRVLSSVTPGQTVPDIVTHALDVAGATNDHQGDDISVETIAAANPDWILVMDRDAAIGQEGQAAAQVLDNELMANTTAWSNGDVTYLDGGRWYIMIHGVDNAVEMLSDASVKPAASAKLNTETPGASIDRLSIMSLRIFHLEEQLERTDVDATHMERVRQRIARCRLQQADLLIRCYINSNNSV